ncbi:MAG: DUF308 domain-containing protein [Bacilli bacterium]|nr:DUF308 domain-containing protein [Bacilli bacterium]
MSDFMKRVIRSSIISALLLAALGVLLIIKSEETVISISYIVGGALVLLGAIGIIDYIRKLRTELKSELDLVYATVTIILGVLIIMHPKAIGSIIPFVLGIIIIINSSTKLNYALQLKKQDHNLWKSTLLVSLLTTICGLVLIFNPFQAASLITRIVGIIILIYAILDIVSSLTIRKNINKIHNAIEENVNVTNEAEVIDEEENKEEKE